MTEFIELVRHSERMYDILSNCRKWSLNLMIPNPNKVLKATIGTQVIKGSSAIHTSKMIVCQEQSRYFTEVVLLLI